MSQILGEPHLQHGDWKDVPARYHVSKGYEWVHDGLGEREFTFSDLDWHKQLNGLYEVAGNPPLFCPHWVRQRWQALPFELTINDKSVKDLCIGMSLREQLGVVHEVGVWIPSRQDVEDTPGAKSPVNVLQRRRRKLEKAIREIEDLERSQAEGSKLRANQIEKIGKKLQYVNELQGLSGGAALLYLRFGTMSQPSQQ